VDSNNVLELKSPNPASPAITLFGANQFGNQLFVRPCYPNLWAVLRSIIEASPRAADCSVTGNPGIGKSMYAVWIMWYLIQEWKTKSGSSAGAGPLTIILHRYQIHSRFSSDGTVQEADMPGLFRSDLMRNTTWYIYDYSGASGFMPNPDYNAKTIVLSSPGPLAQSSFRKERGNTRYMPVWTEAELHACHQFVREFNAVTDEQFQERFKKFGGIARAVFAQDSSDMEERLDAAIALCTLENLEFARTKSITVHELSHRLLHFVVDETKFHATDVVLATKYVRDSILRRFDQEDESKIVSFLKKAAALVYYIRYVFVCCSCRCRFVLILRSFMFV
jgi:hypothetical protein